MAHRPAKCVLWTLIWTHHSSTAASKTMDVKWPDPPLDRSIVGWDPLDEFALYVGDWLLQHGHERDNLEIEAKVGRIIDTETGQRIQLPVMNETIIEMQRGWRFESSMSSVQHGKINALLNSAVEHSQGKVTYERQNEVDLFFSERPADGRKASGKVRVTKDAKSMKTTAVIRKTRIADLNVFCPLHALDYRISINVEEPRAEPPTDEADFTREKNRLHYTHQRICVDLTQVTANAEGAKPTNELELEFLSAAELMEEAQASVHAAGRSEWTPFNDTILIFLNNVRMLIRNAGDK